MFEEYHRIISEPMKRVCFFAGEVEDCCWVDDIFGVLKVGWEKGWICS